MRNKITNLIKSTKIYKYLYPVYTQDYIDHPTEQYKEIKCYKNGDYTHTVKLHYFTTEQISNFHKISDVVENKNQNRSRNMSSNNRKRNKRKIRRRLNR